VASGELQPPQYSRTLHLSSDCVTHIAQKGLRNSGTADLAARRESGILNRRSRILVVDDDERFRELVSSLLTRMGCETSEAATGEEALAAVQLERPALVVLDVRLPGLTGYEVCRELRDEFGDELPIVFVSGERTEPFDRVGGLLLGADEYLVKPLDPNEFLARVRRLLARSASVAPNSASTLTKRELQVLGLLANGLDQAEIAEQLFISPTTVATHIQRVLTKLGAHSRAQAVALAHREDLLGRFSKPAKATT
jgi:two-component system nitrate/nitrite response regulator NarL